MSPIIAPPSRPTGELQGELRTLLEALFDLYELELPQYEPVTSRVAPEGKAPPTPSPSAAPLRTSPLQRSKAPAPPALSPVVPLVPTHLSTKPLALEFTPTQESDQWGDLTVLMKGEPFGPALPPADDLQARRIRQLWRARTFCADVLIVTPPGGTLPPFFDRLAHAIFQHCCPVALASPTTWSSLEDAESCFHHPEVRLLLLSHEALQALPTWKHRIKNTPHGPILCDRPLLVLEPWERYEQEPEFKRALWSQILLWKRPQSS